MFSAVAVYQEQSGVRTSPDHAHSQGRDGPYQFPGLGPGPISGLEGRHCLHGKGNRQHGWFQTLNLSWQKATDCGLLLLEKKKMKDFLKWKKMVLSPVFTCNRCQLLIEHPHWCWWWHHPHESPHRGACSGRSTRLLLLCCSLSLLLLSNFSCPLCKGISDFQFCF